MKNIPSFIHNSNGQLHDFEVTYLDGVVPFSACATETHIVKGTKSVKNALDRFSRAVPNHGPIKSVRKVVVR